MSWEKSDVMVEFLKIAQDSGLVKTARPEPNPYAEDEQVIKDKRLKTPEKSIIEEAHPDPVFIAESRGEGALVENEIEHQQKMVEIINKHPTGSIVGRYAATSIELLKIADACDSTEQTEAAKLLTKAAEHLLLKADAELFFE